MAAVSSFEKGKDRLIRHRNVARIILEKRLKAPYGSAQLAAIPGWSASLAATRSSRLQSADQ
jgi:hypothetical protein